VNDLDVVAGIIEQLAGRGLFMREVRFDQRKVAGAQPSQQIVERPVDRTSHFTLPRRHPKCPLPRGRDNN